MNQKKKISSYQTKKANSWGQKMKSVGQGRMTRRYERKEADEKEDNEEGERDGEEDDDDDE